MPCVRLAGTVLETRRRGGDLLKGPVAAVMSDLRLGDTIDVNECDYRFGVGQLTLRLTQIGQRQRTADGDWIDVEGLELRDDGSQISQQPRPVSVRVSGVHFRRGINAR